MDNNSQNEKTKEEKNFDIELGRFILLFEYVNGNNDVDFDEGNRLCIIQDVDEHLWE
jgi:hypothetical protein